MFRGRKRKHQVCSSRVSNVRLCTEESQLSIYKRAVLNGIHAKNVRDLAFKLAPFIANIGGKSSSIFKSFVQIREGMEKIRFHCDAVMCGSFPGNVHCLPETGVGLTNVFFGKLSSSQSWSCLTDAYFWGSLEEEMKHRTPVGSGRGRRKFRSMPDTLRYRIEEYVEICLRGCDLSMSTLSLFSGHLKGCGRPGSVGSLHNKMTKDIVKVSKGCERLKQHLGVITAENPLRNALTQPTWAPSCIWDIVLSYI